MTKPLYQLVKEIEDSNATFSKLKISSGVDVAGVQKDLFKAYENNPILKDAIDGRQSIKESLLELGEKNKGIWKIMPWRKDSMHNKRLSQMEQLVGDLNHLRTRGIFYPDNLITAGTEAAGVVSLGLVAYTLVLSNSPTINEFPFTAYHALKDIKESFLSCNLISFFGFGFVIPLMSEYHRFTALPLIEAKYLDNKVNKFYK